MSPELALRMYEEFTPVIRQISFFNYRVGGQVDARSWDRDDAKQELKMRVLELLRNLPDNTMPKQECFLFVAKSLWNLSLDWTKENSRLPVKVEFRPDHLELDDLSYTMDDYVESKARVDALRAKLPSSMLTTLVKFTGAKGRFRDLAETSFTEGERKCLKRKVEKARTLAKKILNCEKKCPKRQPESLYL